MKKSLVLLCGVVSVMMLSFFAWRKGPDGAAAGPQPPSAPPAPERSSTPAAPADGQSGPPSSATATATAADPAAAAAADATLPVGALTNAREPRRMPDFQKVVAFNDWAQRWKAADADQRADMEAEGVRLAEARRPEFKALIISDPRRALEQAVPRVILQDLPRGIAEVLEKPVSDKGNYNVYQGRPMEGAPVPEGGLTLRYFEASGGTSYKAHVFGDMESVTSRKDVPLRGVAIDRELAVAESPVRRLEEGERVAAEATVDALCPVSKKETPAVAPEEPINEETPAVEVGKRVILLCNGSHVTVLDEQYKSLIQASGQGGAGYFQDNFPGTSSEAIGNFRCLYIRVTYPEQLKAPNTEDSAYGDMRNVSRFYLENSYGKLTTTSVVTPLIVLPHTQAWYIAKDSEVDGLGLVHSDSRSEARRLGYDSTQFNCTIVRVNGGPRLSGISWGGGDSVWVSWDGMDVLNHECGHSLGRNHANFWKTTDGTPYGQGANEEYGNPFDVMGGGGGFGAHYNTISKRALGWLPDNFVHKPAANGVYRLYAYDQPQLEEGRRYAFRVAKDNARTYYVEYHPANGSLTDSALVMYSWSGMSNAGHVLDTTPGTPGGKGDGGIQIGRTYTDPEADMHFTVLGKNATTPPSLDLVYNHGPFPGNLPPVVTLTASATSIAAGGSVTFTAAATDPNDDTLAYHWDFNDGVAITSTPVFTRVFPTADQMTVMLTVSDMKGGVTRKHVLVNVGAHGRQSMTGQILANGQPVVGVRVSNGSKYCFTDSAGNYILSDLTTGSHTFTATLAGFTFEPGFGNPGTIVSGTNIGNWTAVASTFVTLTKTSDATEGGAAGTFLLTRTGDTSAALTVRVAAVSGSATKATDYTFAPDYVDDGLFKTWQIPAGSATLPITVAAVNDTSAEGPETISLTLASNGAYFAAGLNNAVMTVEDNDSTLPKIKVLPSGPYALEAPAENGSFTFTRTGPTTAPLSVSVAYSGSATNGSDYTNPGATVTFPAGQSSVTVNIAPLNDALIETPEECIVTINSGAAWLRDSTAQTATVVLNDDDSPIVTVTATDAAAAEQGRDPGVFLITRTGSTAAALKVYYGLSGSALHGTDYIALPGEITIPSGAASVPVIITPYDDDLGEPDTQSVVLGLTTFGSAYSLGTSFSATLNITDNDDTPVIAVRAGTSPSEPSTAGTFIFRAIASATGNVTVRYTISGTATSGTDFTALSGTVSVPATGSTDLTVNVPILNDSLPEDTETIIATITPDPAYKVYNDGTATLRLKDDEKAERVMVSTWNETPSESGTTARFYISRGASAATGLAVNYVISGTSTNGSDFTLLPGFATIPAEADGVDVLITPTNDTLVEGTETITMTLTSGTTYSVDVPGSATLYLTDNETPAVDVKFAAAAQTTTEAPGVSGEFRDIPVTLSAASTGTVTVEYVSGGGTASGDDTDWTFVNAGASNAVIPRGVLTFPPGTTTQNIRIRIKNDGVVEGSETAIIKLQNALGARISTSLGTQTVTINDANNPLRRVRFLVSASTRSESEGTEPMLMAVLDRAADATPTTVAFTVSGTATPGVDFILTPGTLTFAAGETLKMLPLSILPDALTEVPETVVVTLTNPVNAELGGVTTHTLTIRESTISAVNISATPPDVPENAGPAQFTITRSGASNALALTVDYSVAGSAAAGTDYTATSGTLTIAAGSNTAMLSVPLIDDSEEEPDETLVVTLGASAAYDLGAAASATATIEDDDAAPVVVVTEPLRAFAAIPSQVGLMLRAEGSRTTPQGSSNLPVVWSKLSGPGTVTFESAGLRSAATFSANGDYVLRATSTFGTVNGFTDFPVRVGIPLTAANVGATTAAGSWSETDAEPGSGLGGTLTVRGAGSGISSSGTSDGFYFLASPATGDFDVKCRVLDITNTGGSTSFRAGIMVRASTAATAPYAMALLKADRSNGFHARLTSGADPYDSTGSTALPNPLWIRLTRVGDAFSAFYSQDDGTTWTQRGTTQTISTMGASPLLGLALTSAVQATASTAVFDSFDALLPTNIGPFVNAGTDLTGGGPWNLDATVTDDARPAPSVLTTLWQLQSGPGTATFAAPTAVDTGVTFGASGNYVLRLTASDKDMTTFDDTAASVVSLSPLAAWRNTWWNQTTDAGDAANMADPDHDGLVNLLEYALGGSPTQSGTTPLNIVPSEGQWSFQLTREADRNDVRMTLQSSPDLATWSPVARSEGGQPFTALTPDTVVSETGTGSIAVNIQVGLPAASTPRIYFRMAVELASGPLP